MPPAHRRLLALALAAGWAAAHVCLLAPAQRSGLPADLGALPGGADACYSSRKCPPRVAGGPVTALAGGQGFDVLLQQNLNHYNPGWPGTLDVSFSFDDGASWAVLVTVPDW